MHLFNKQNKPMATSLEDAKRKDASVPESKVISLQERAKDDGRPFLDVSTTNNGYSDNS